MNKAIRMKKEPYFEIWVKNADRETGYYGRSRSKRKANKRVAILRRYGIDAWHTPGVVWVKA